MSVVGETASNHDPQSVIYIKFDSYPWAKDRDFMFGASAMSSDGASTFSGSDGLSSASLDLMRHSRIWWYRQKYNTAIDLAAYKTWLTANPTHETPDAAILAKLDKILSRVKEQSSSANSDATPTAAVVPSWQSAAPRTDLRVKPDEVTEKRDGASPADAPYPDKFAVIVEALAAGKAVPGIREIPNKVVRNPSVRPIGALRAPAKPWERRADAGSPAVEALADSPPPSTSLDAQFPDVEGVEDQDDRAEEDAEVGKAS